jgi:protein-tyrosine phosphatase
MISQITPLLHLCGYEDVLRLLNKGKLEYYAVLSIMDKQDLEDLKLLVDANPNISDNHTYIPLIDAEPVETAKIALELAIGTINNFRKTGTVLVHCGAGWSRSASAVIGALMDKEFEGMSRPEAYAHVKKMRPDICPAPSFMNALKEIYGEESCLP